METTFIRRPDGTEQACRKCSGSVWSGPLGNRTFCEDPGLCRFCDPPEQIRIRDPKTTENELRALRDRLREGQEKTHGLLAEIETAVRKLKEIAFEAELQKTGIRSRLNEIERVFHEKENG